MKSKNEDILCLSGLEDPDAGEWVCVKKYFTKHAVPDKNRIKNIKNPLTK